MKINITQEDYEFLKDLKRELNTQDTDGNAQPVYWGVEETYEECRGEDGNYGGDPYIVYDDGNWSVEDAVQEVETAFKNEHNDYDDYDDDIRASWGEVDKTSAEDVCSFMQDQLGWYNVYGVVYVEKVKRISENKCAFITKRACKEYIEKYRYNLNDPHTYAMTAYRNFELERLLNILKNLEFEN